MLMQYCVSVTMLLGNTFIQFLFFAKLELVDNLFTALVNDQDETIIYAMSIIITI